MNFIAAVNVPFFYLFIINFKDRNLLRYVLKINQNNYEYNAFCGKTLKQKVCGHILKMSKGNFFCS